MPTRLLLRARKNLADEEARLVVGSLPWGDSALTPAIPTAARAPLALELPTELTVPPSGGSPPVPATGPLASIPVEGAPQPYDAATIASVDCA